MKSEYIGKRVKIININGFSEYINREDYINKEGKIVKDYGNGYRFIVKFDNEKINEIDQRNGQLCFKVEHIEFIGDEKKMKKSDINQSMLFKLRDGRLCTLLHSNMWSGLRLFDKKCLNSNTGGAIVALNSLTEDLLHFYKDINIYDIISIKQFAHQVQVLNIIQNENEPEKWDWIRLEHRKPEPKKMTLKQIEEALGYDIKIIE